MKRLHFKFIIFLAAIYSNCAFSQPIIIDGKVVPEDVLAETFLLKASLIPNYREEMRSIIEAISSFAKNKNPEFIIAVKGGEDLFFKTKWEQKLSDLQRAEKNNDKTDEEEFLSKMFNPKPAELPVGTVIKPYIKSIDAWFATDLVCKNTPATTTTANLLKEYNIPLLSAENCSIRQKNADYVFGYLWSNNISDAPPINNSPNNIFSMDQARNVFFMLDNSYYHTKAEEIEAIRNNNYDVIVINPFLKKHMAFNKSEVEKMKVKKIGGKRLVLAYFNISVINENMYFWKQHWQLSNPAWIRLPSPFSVDNFVVEYWWDDWKDITDRFLKSVMMLGFDGIFIDGLDYHYLFEQTTPI